MSEYITKTKNMSIAPVESRLFDTMETITLGLAVVFNTITNSSAGMIALFLYLVAAIFFRKTKYIIPYMMFLIPNLAIIHLPVLGVPMVNVLLSVAVLKMIVSGKRMQINTKTLSLMYLIIAYEMLHIVLYGYFALLPLLLWIFAILFVTMSTSVPNEDYSHKLTINYFLSGLLVSILIGIISTDGLLQNLNRFHGGAGDPNYLALYILIGLFAVFEVLPSEKDKFTKMFYYGMLIIMPIFGFLTLSRMFLLVFFAGLLMFFFYLMVTPKLKSLKRKIIPMLLLAILVFLFLPNQYTTPIVESLQFTFNRFVQNKNNFDNLTSGRNIIGANIMSFLINEPVYMFFGIGIQQYNLRIPNIASYAHNIILEMLVTLGVVGSIIFSLFIISLIFNERKQHYISKPNFVSFLPFIIMFGSYMFLNALEIESFYVLLVFCIKHLFADPIQTNRIEGIRY